MRGSHNHCLAAMRRPKTLPYHKDNTFDCQSCTNNVTQSCPDPTLFAVTTTIRDATGCLRPTLRTTVIDSRKVDWPACQVRNADDIHELAYSRLSTYNHGRCQYAARRYHPKKKFALPRNPCCSHVFNTCMTRFFNPTRPVTMSYSTRAATFMNGYRNERIIFPRQAPE